MDASDSAATRTAAIFDAYLTADAARGFRRQVWALVLVLAIAGFVLALTTRLFAPGGLARGLGVLVIIAIAAAVHEWRAGRALGRLLDR